ncbi:conserved hypothetical protein [Streptomyces viridosporus ATCC 14672]|uniref:Uncharacterized protein n=1 Tax=Streptomyces viridosporus (strain ATCC 14672 / DSM 40746 / JCM 4963 / KCTC 9882 / NRRL B-12104 / FH 1290) TaxID=566461 RepID=D5ZXM9_STRV1|nr:conserved hypothetical protein [Streptomyces viridosporus ATCC 14672]
MSLFQGRLPYQVDVQFEAEPQDPSMSMLMDTCDQAQVPRSRAPDHARVIPEGGRRSGTTLVSRHFQRRNTL